MKAVMVEIPPGPVEVLGSEETVRQRTKVALVLDLVRRGKLSRARAAELFCISLRDFPPLLREYEIPWFDCSDEDLQRDLGTLRDRGTSPR